MNELDDPSIAKRVRTMQIITFALINGVVVFLAIACYMVYVQRQGEGQWPADALPILTIIAVAMLVPAAIVSFILPNIFVQSNLNKIAAGTWQPPPGANPQDFASDAVKLLAARQMGLIIGLALLEGPAFVACTGFLVEARLYTLPIIAVAVIMMLLRFPTESGVRGWLQEQLDKLSAMR